MGKNKGEEVVEEEEMTRRRRKRGRKGDGGRDLQPVTSDPVVIVVPLQA